MKTREEIINELKPHCPTANEVVCSDGADQQVMYLDDVADLVERYEARTGFGTFRQECAKAAMAQMIGMGRDDGYKYSPKEVAAYAVIYADALIAELMDVSEL